MSMSHLLFYFGLLLTCLDFSCTTNLPICKEKECLSYRVLQKKLNYEIREYNDLDERRVVRTFIDVKTGDIIEAQQRMIKAMKDYLNGNNNMKINVSNALPIMDFIGQYKYGLDLGLFIWLPKSMVTPPKPLDVSLQLAKGTTTIFYAARLNNSPTVLDIQLAAVKLRNALKADGKLKREYNPYFIAKYAEKFENNPKTVDVMFISSI